MKYLFFFIASIMLASCAVHKRADGRYKVLTARPIRPKAIEVTIHGLPGRYILQTDTIKAGDSIYINFIHRY